MILGTSDLLVAKLTFNLLDQMSNSLRHLHLSFLTFGLLIASKPVRAVHSSVGSSSSASTLQYRVPIKELKHDIQTILRNQGHSVDAAGTITETLLFAELRNNNQGIVKLLAGAIKPNHLATAMNVVHESKVSAKLDGGQNIGMVVLKRSVDMAIEKAKHSGIAIVGCSNYSSATGALGAWAREIVQNDLVGIVMSQCPEMVAPYGSFEPIFGTNPIAIGVPTKPRPQVLDMATSASGNFFL
jgi:LDH2 family malate/lactate/ureidoglycolate dehydrogenase